MYKNATLSQDRKYRYTLERHWNVERGRICWIMLNPSTADEEFDDPTIRRCIRFTESFGRGAMTVVNLSPFRATKPRDLMGKLIEELWGDNEVAILAATEYADLVIAAWGSVHQDLRDLEARMIRTVRRNVLQLHCLRINGDGSPGHPLYLPKDCQLVKWPKTA